MPSTRRSLGAGASLLAVAAAAAAFPSGAASGPAAKGPQIALTKSVAHDDIGGEDCGHAFVQMRSKIWVAGFRSGEANGRNATFDEFKPSLAWEGGYGMDGWQHADDEYDAAAVSRAGEVFVVGYSTQVGRGRDVFLQKFMKNVAGASVSTYVDAIGGDDAAHGVAVTRDGTVFVVGEMTEPRSGTNVWLGKYDADLNRITSGSYGSPDVAGDGADDVGRAIAIDSVGDLFVAGTVVRAGTGADIWVGKFDADLHLEAEAWVAGAADGTDAAHALLIDRKGRVWVAGSIAVPGDDRDVWLGAFDGDLVPIGSVTHAGPAGDAEALSLATDDKGHLFVAGRTTTQAGARAPWLGVFDTHFAFVADTTYTGGVGLGGIDGAYEVKLVSKNTLLVVGATTTAEGGADHWIAKYKVKRLPKVREP